ncbi:GNAT family N-acetyltransferase [Cognatishimia maritima]|nr:GNAT family N-acetyltransferase [Cognatishimia maritima]
MTTPITIKQLDPTDPIAIACLESYYTELAARFERGFDVSLSRDPEAQNMMPPLGAFFVAMSGGAALGCCGLKGDGSEVAEIKRLWVNPTARGMGLAQRLLAECEVAARGLGITVLRLDTNSALPEAERLYRKTGWTQIERFNDDPYPDLFFEKAVPVG